MAPSVSSVSPNQGPTTGGTPVTITGSGFTGATLVAFGTLKASFTVVNDGRIDATSPGPATAGTVDVRVASAAGQSAITANDQFTYYNPKGQPVPRSQSDDSSESSAEESG